MTISDSIIAWLNSYVEGRVDTDILSDSPLTFALSKQPIINIKSYVSGKEEHTEYYQFLARFDSQTNSDRRDNQSFFEGLESWIYEQNKGENFPAIQNARVESISVSSSYYMGATKENTAMYSLTIALQFTKEN